MGRASRRKKEVPRDQRLKDRTQVEVRNAHHEAAHAVVAHVFSIPFEHTTRVGKRGPSAGIGLGPHPGWFEEWRAAPHGLALDDGQREYVRNVMRATYAGPVSDARLAGADFEPDDFGAPGSDGRVVASLAWRLVGGEDQEPALAALYALWQETAELVERHWTQIEVVARALLQRPSLTSGEVAALVDTRDILEA